MTKEWTLDADEGSGNTLAPSGKQKLGNVSNTDAGTAPSAGPAAF